MIDKGRAEQRHDERRDARAMRDQVARECGRPARDCGLAAARDCGLAAWAV